MILCNIWLYIAVRQQFAWAEDPEGDYRYNEGSWTGCSGVQGLCQGGRLELVSLHELDNFSLCGIAFMINLELNRLFFPSFRYSQFSHIFILLSLPPSSLLSLSFPHSSPQVFLHGGQGLFDAELPCVDHWSYGDPLCAHCPRDPLCCS